ncbi:hypothetical protein ACTM6J_20240 [Citrobacter freundii]
MSKPHKLEILLAWLEDNVAMGTEIILALLQIVGGDKLIIPFC